MKAGRHRTFDKDIALEQAMEVFWTNGYPGTSLTDLTQAMGINKPSLYAAFGNKGDLFTEALDWYVKKYGTHHTPLLYVAEKNIRERIQLYLTSIAEIQTNSNLPGGCFLCSSTSEISGTGFPSGAKQFLSKINELTKSALVEFFKGEQLAGKINSDRSPVMLANYILTLQFGLALLARNGAGFKELNGVIMQATQVF